jgi:hypothetical protein
VTSAALAVLLAMTPGPAPPPAPAPVRLVTTPSLHLGARPAVLLTSESREIGIGATLQVTVRTPW